MHFQLAGKDFYIYADVKRVNKDKVPSDQTETRVLAEKIVRKL